MFILLLGLIQNPVQASIADNTSSDIPIIRQVYSPQFDEFNIKESMILSPLFTPDNAIHIYSSWLSRANTTIEVQNQYITQWDDSVSWDQDPSPIVRELVNAKSRGVNVRVQVREDSDSDDVASYLLSKGIQVRFMGSSASTDGSYLSATHNKMIVIDDKVSLISSINFGENAFTNNREAGMVIVNTRVAQYYKSIFDADWNDGDIPVVQNSFSTASHRSISPNSNYVSHTDIPKSNFSGVYNVTAFANPDNADEVIFRYLKSAKTSIYVSMYTISRPEFNNTLIELKKNNPNLDIQVLISNRRVGKGENIDTNSAARSLVENLIPVYNSTKDSNSVNGFYHNKYWIIDGKDTFIYSGNWSPRSVTEQLPAGETYSSGYPNRDVGIAVHNAPDIADFVKKEVWDKDVAVASAWELPIGIKINNLKDAEVVKGEFTLSGVVNGLDSASISYQIGTSSFEAIQDATSGFSVKIDSTKLNNGITSLTVKAELNGQTFTDNVEVNIVNIPDTDNWRFLITEVLSNPDTVSDSKGEFIELTNSFPFDLLIGNWKVGDDTNLMNFPKGYIIDSYSSIIIARNKAGFDDAYSVEADFELGISLKNSADFVQLQYLDGDLIDVISYGMQSPDGSDQLDAADAGLSIQRSPLHVDTDAATDFIYAKPDPKGNVPQEPFSTIERSTEEGTPLNIWFGVITFFVGNILLRYRRNVD